MSTEPPVKPVKEWSNSPQIIAAVITSVATVLVALISVLPNLMPKAEATATPVIVVVTPTVASPTPIPSTPVEVSVELTPTFEQLDVSLAMPTDTSIPPTMTSAPQPPTSAPPIASTLSPNVLLMYDEVSFTVLNQSTRVISLEGIVFRSSAGEWDAVRWGASLYNSLPIGMCLRMRDASVGQRQPPQPCVNNIYGLIEAQGSALFWMNVDQFEVLRNNSSIASCPTAAETCAIYVP